MCLVQNRETLLKQVGVRKRKQSKSLLVPAVSHFVSSLLQVIIGMGSILLENLNQICTAQHVQDVAIRVIHEWGDQDEKDKAKWRVNKISKRRAYNYPSQTSAYGSKLQLANAVLDEGEHKNAKWLQSQDAYTLHAPFTRRIHHKPTTVSDPGIQLQADLMNVSSHSRHNDYVKCLLTIVGVFSRLV